MFKNVYLFCLIIVLLTACNTNNESATAKKESKKAGVELISAEQFKQKIEATNNRMIVDLRSHRELHEVGLINGSRNFNYDAGRLQTLIDNVNEDTAYFLYCASGNRSSKASQELINAGATKVYDLNGGINAWEAAGYPIAKHSH